MIGVGVIGYGYWGPNIVRNFNALSHSHVVSVCDKNEDALKKISSQNKNIRVCTNADDILTATDIDLVAIVTPVSTHYELAKKALRNGKHIFVEKPFTETLSQANELLELAETKKVKIMVDHTFTFTGAVRKIKELVDQKQFGEIIYYDSTRINLGLFQHDVNVIWDLAPHDFSIMLYLLDEQPTAVAASGRSHFYDLVDVAYITVYFNNNTIAHFNVNWLSPVKIRNTLIGGKKKMLFWNDVSPDEKIKVYDKGVEVQEREGIYDLLVSYRSGDIWTPRIEQREALALACDHFVTSIQNNTLNMNSAFEGRDVVRLLEACDKSLANNGRQVML
jgi:predicted dehydrogenase